MLTLIFVEFDPKQGTNVVFGPANALRLPQLPTAASEIVLGWACDGAIERSGAEFITPLWTGTCERML
jgi:hypothetical protein